MPEGTGQEQNPDDVDKLLKELGISPEEGAIGGAAGTSGQEPDPAASIEDAEKAFADITAAQIADEQGVKKPQLEKFTQTATEKPALSIDALKDVNLHLKIELGRSRMYVQDILKFASGSIIELDKLTGDPLDIYVNDRLVARGEILVINDNFAIRVTEIITPIRS